ncbi:MAG TPA: class I SAM-dependent methyltransferase [Sedimentisphaerales bacterium]|nr:class I SAM-dependent methyltransferase [Sedimentisphaerales bacterium]
MAEINNKQVPITLIPLEYINVLFRYLSQTVSLPGDVIEIGVYKGGSLYRMAKYIQQHHSKDFKGKKVIGIDTFEGHPYHNPEVDPSHHFTGRFSDASFEEVIEALAPLRFVKVLKGECMEVFTKLPADQQFCFAHIDADIAQSAVASIMHIFPRLSPGGVIVFDEYQGYGQEAFINEYFADKEVRLLPRTGLPSGKDYGLIVLKEW